MYFLGQAANLRGQTLRHTFAFGTARDSLKLKQHLAKRYGAPLEQVTLYHTGRTALAAAIRHALSLNKTPSQKVLITAFTCHAVVEAVRAAGATPVFADIEPETLHFNAKTLEQALKKHPDIGCVVIQNSLGHPCKIADIEKVLSKHHIPVVEDLAHCAGISYADGREAGTISVAIALSFGKGKSIDTTSGGALIIRKTTSSNNGQPSDIPVPQPAKLPPLSDRLRDRFYPFFGASIRLFYHQRRLGRLLTGVLVKLHFIQKSADAPLDFNYRLTHWQAKLALRQLENIPKNRPPLREFYFVREREQCLKALDKAGFIMRDLWYETPVAPARYYQKSGFQPAACPIATELSAKIINLPAFYSSSDLAPARKIISKYQLKEPLS